MTSPRTSGVWPMNAQPSRSSRSTPGAGPVDAPVGRPLIRRIRSTVSAATRKVSALM